MIVFLSFIFFGAVLASPLDYDSEEKKLAAELAAAVLEEIDFANLFDGATRDMDACEPPHNPTVHGCAIDDGACHCGVGCKAHYRYETIEECRQVLKGEGKNACQPNPCGNDGFCTQISQKPWYKCQCAGTGFHGNHCEKACPPFNGQTDFPFECVLI